EIHPVHGGGKAGGTVSACSQGKKPATTAHRVIGGKAQRRAIGQIKRQGLAGLQGGTAARIPSLQIGQVDVEAFGDAIQGVAFTYLVEGGSLRLGRLASTAMQRQDLIDPQVVTGQFVPALQVL